MILEQHYLDCLAQASYLLVDEATGVAAVVDPRRDVDLYLDRAAELGARIEQRNPIARVASSPDYYLDEDGKKMPLSSVYTARVPLVTGRSQSDLTGVTQLLLEIEEDDLRTTFLSGWE